MYVHYEMSLYANIPLISYKIYDKPRDTTEIILLPLCSLSEFEVTLPRSAAEMEIKHVLSCMNKSSGAALNDGVDI